MIWAQSKHRLVKELAHVVKMRRRTRLIVGVWTTSCVVGGRESVAARLLFASNSCSRQASSISYILPAFARTAALWKATVKRPSYHQGYQLLRLGLLGPVISVSMWSFRSAEARLLLES
jgi:hypothetical protein